MLALVKDGLRGRGVGEIFGGAETIAPWQLMVKLDGIGASPVLREIPLLPLCPSFSSPSAPNIDMSPPFPLLESCSNKLKIKSETRSNQIKISLSESKKAQSRCDDLNLWVHGRASGAAD